MSCCSNPNIKSSTYCDWCTNCGWQFNYITNEESFETPERDSDEDS